MKLNNVGHNQGVAVSNGSSYNSVGGSTCHNNSGINYEAQTSSSGNRRKIWKMSVILTSILILLILVAMLSFLRFRY